MDTGIKPTQLPHALAVLIGFTYITGYLIDFFYFTSRGVTDVGGDLFKLRYIHIGMYFDLILALFVGTPIFFVLNQRPGTGGPIQSAMPATREMGWVPICYQASLIIPTILAPPDFFSRSQSIAASLRYFSFLFLIFLVLIIFIAGRYIILRISEQPEKLKIARVVGIAILVTIGLCDLPVFYGLAPIFYSMFPNVLFFVGFCLALSLILAFGYTQISEHLETNHNGTSFALVRQVYLYIVSAVVILFFIAVSYAYVVFPFIPVEKGGANFTSSNRVSVSMRSNNTDEAVTLRLKNTLLIYATSNSLFFATPAPENDACDWQTRASAMSDLIQIPREEVRSISQGPTLPNCF